MSGDTQRYRKVAAHADAGCRVLHRFEDGWTAREYLTPQAVRAVGEGMANCWRQVNAAMQLPWLPYVEPDGPRRFGGLHDASGMPRVAFDIVRDPREDGPLRFEAPGRVANSSCIPEDAERFEAWNRAYGHPTPARIRHVGGEWEPLSARAVRQFWFEELERKWFLADGRVRVFHPTRPGVNLAGGLLWVTPVRALALARQAAGGMTLEAWVDRDRLEHTGTEDEFEIVGFAPGELRPARPRRALVTPDAICGATLRSDPRCV